MSETRFSGKQVLGVVVLALVILGLGLASGGWIGYRLGRSEGAQAAAPQAAAPSAPDQRQAVHARLKANFTQIFPSEKVQMADVIDNIIRVLNG
jgi:hypothetical protein